MKTSPGSEYFALIADLVGRGAGRLYRMTDRDEEDPVTVSVYTDLPEQGLLTAFSFGLSSAQHPEWVASKPELMLSVRSRDHAWALCVGEIIRRSRAQALFAYGTVLHFRQQIADESRMTSFLVFASDLLAPEDAKVSLSDRTVMLSQLYPIHESEARVIRDIGAERFFFDSGIDFEDVRRPPLGSA